MQFAMRPIAARPIKTLPLKKNALIKKSRPKLKTMLY
jgi:hypothetical protein